MPSELEGMEVEIRTRTSEQEASSRRGPDAVPRPHVAVVPRRAPDGQVVHSAVFFELAAGPYEAYLRRGETPTLPVHITGGQVAFANWPE
ncbi:hypothetical protein [Fodinicola feengrottensis]|nr:hypothetical protein [Fodinicola feengrottensis]